MIKKYFILILSILIFTSIIHTELSRTNITPAFSYERKSKLKTTMLSVPDGATAPCIFDWDGNGTLDILSGTGKGTVVVFPNSIANGQSFSSYESINAGGILLYYSSTPVPFISTNVDINGDQKPDLMISSADKVYIYTNKATSVNGLPPVFNKKPQLILFFTNYRIANDDGDVTNMDKLYVGNPIIFDWAGKKCAVVSYSLQITDDYDNILKIGFYTNISGRTNWNKILVMETNGTPLKITNNGYGSSSPYVGSVFPTDWDNDGIIDILLLYTVKKFEFSCLDDGGTPAAAKEHTKLMLFRGKANYNNDFNSGVEVKLANGKSIDFGGSPFVIDWDADGNDDIILSSLANFRLIERSGSGINDLIIPDDITKKFFQGSETDLYAGSDPVIVDFDNDGVKDLIAGNGSGSIYLFKNYGNNENMLFKASSRLRDINGNFIINANAAWIHPRVFDINNDDLNDILFKESNGGAALAAFTNCGTASNWAFNKAVRMTNIDGGDIGGANVYIIDWNNDGRLDIISGGGSSQKVYWGIATNRKGEIIKVRSGIDFEQGNYGLSLDLGSMGDQPHIVDWNNDGLLDIVTAAENKVVWAQGLGFHKTGTNAIPYFSEKQDIIVGGAPIAAGEHAKLYLTDINNDQWYDMILGNTSYYIDLYTGSIPRYVSETNVIMPEESVMPYPNPAIDTINFRYLVRDDSIVSIEIYTYTGKLIEAIKSSGRYDRENIYQYDISDLSNGVYFVKIKAKSSINGEEKVITRKFVVLR